MFKVFNNQQVMLLEHCFDHINKTYRVFLFSYLFKMITTVKFYDETGNDIADMDVIMRLLLSGPTVINDFKLDGNVDKQYIAIRNEYKCPEVPEFKMPTKEYDDEWVVVGAEFGNGQKIAIKYKRSCYELTSGIDRTHELCDEESEEETTKSEEKLNNHMHGLMVEMHKLIAANTTTP